MDKYEPVDIRASNFGMAKLMRNKDTRELVDMKFIERGNRIDEYVIREIINHRALNHPNIIRFKEVVLTPTHLAIMMEYAAGGQLLERMCQRFQEDEARYFFQQLVCGVSFCQAMCICHRDIKPENTLLDGNPAPRLKICNFQYSKWSVLHSQPKSTVGTPAYMAPEVLSRREYDGNQADVWSCGVMLYVMLVGGYPFQDPGDPKNLISYKIPDYVKVSQDCRNLLSRIFVQNPAKRITVREIKSHPWYLENLPRELKEGAQAAYFSLPRGVATRACASQSLEEIMTIVQEARRVPEPARPVSGYGRDDEGAKQVEMENIRMEFDSLESTLGGCESPRNLKLPFLQFITKNFSDELIIGIGGCAVVYKGVLRNQIIAVKKLLNRHTIDDKMFHCEVKSMMMVKHKNVVRFLGYCSHTEERAIIMQGKHIMAQDRERLLCFEYLINGSLESYLTDELRGLEWQTRYQIIKGICYGLQHLHCENHIVHMDLKPANILLDSNMVPKITDFGLSRLDNISRTMSSERLVSLGYCAPEYLHHGQMSAKSDIYSLGVIILELLTGSKEDPNITKVHRRWKHRWNKTARDAQLGYKQVATCLDLVGRCKQIDPTHRPNTWDIISCLNEMDSSDAKTECLELDDMLGVDPLEIHLPLELNMQISRSVELTNDTDDHFAFRVSTTSLRPYCIEQNEGTVPPRSKCSVTISMQAMDRALPWHRCRDEFYVQSTRVDGSLAAMNIGGDIFNEEPGKVIDTVNFSVLIEASSPSADH